MVQFAANGWFDPIVFCAASRVDDRQGQEPVIRGNQREWQPCATMTARGFPAEFQSCLAVTTLFAKSFQDFPFVINRLPQVVNMFDDLHDSLVQVPQPS